MRLATVLLILTIGVACSPGPVEYVNPPKAQFYELLFVNNGSRPAHLISLFGGGRIELQSGTLVPYALGKAGDQRLVNDRTGNGNTGGNSRDTTVRRGEMMDLRVLRIVSATGESFMRDSSVVDVTLQDTLFIVSRPHPDRKRTRIDTGYFVDSLLVVWTDVDLSFLGLLDRPRRQLTYRVTR